MGVRWISEHKRPRHPELLTRPPLHKEARHPITTSKGTLSGQVARSRAPVAVRGAHEQVARFLRDKLETVIAVYAHPVDDEAEVAPGMDAAWRREA